MGAREEEETGRKDEKSVSVVLLLPKSLRQLVSERFKEEVRVGYKSALPCYEPEFVRQE